MLRRCSNCTFVRRKPHALLVVWRERLSAVDGPAVVEEETAVTVVPRVWKAAPIVIAT